MKILLAPNSMKGSLDALSFSEIMKHAFHETDPSFECRLLPVADGGDGTGEILIRALNLDRIVCVVNDPLGRSLNAEYGLKNDLAVIEMASASGMKNLRKDELNPMLASSFGTGELIRDAIRRGATEIWLGLGGSATVDGGSGLLEALGFRFFAESGQLIHGRGESLLAIRRIDSSENEVSSEIKIKLICDVDNPLLGEKGAARVFAPQKGASGEMLECLESGLVNWCQILQKETARILGDDAGDGAAGGIPVAMKALFCAETVAGADFILNKIDFDKHLEWADVVITGEGKLDAQSLSQKAPFVVACRARERQKKVFALTGICESLNENPFDEIFPLVDAPDKINYSMMHSQELIYEKTIEIARLLKNRK